MYSLEWHTFGMLHKNMHYEKVNCTRLERGHYYCEPATAAGNSDIVVSI